MDQERFDRIAAALGGAATRRAGLKAALAALAGLSGRELAAAAPERGDGQNLERDGEGSEVDSEKRPCGPKPKDNRCTKHKDCCTKYCRKPKKQAKFGRCRCIKRGKKCKAGQKCCSAMTCRNGRCTKKQPAPATCTVCASGCLFTSVNAAYAAAADGDVITIDTGTYPTGIEVTKSVTLAACNGATGVKLTPDRNVLVHGHYSVAVESSTDTTTRHTLTLLGLDLASTSQPIVDEVLLCSEANGTVTFIAQGCTMSGAFGGMYAKDGDHSFTQGSVSNVIKPFSVTPAVQSGSLTLTSVDIVGALANTVYFSVTDGVSGALTVDSCTIHDGTALLSFTGNKSDTAAQRALTTMSITNSEFKDTADVEAIYVDGGVVTVDGCTITGNYGGGIRLFNADLTVSNTTISGNGSADPNTQGGGVLLNAQQANVTATFGSGVVVTNNTAVNGAGVAALTTSSYTVTVTGASSSNIYGNNTENCETYASSTWTPVVNCNF